ncbi:MAG: hypothetical protein RIS94_2049, partial [Pseudomonadota bacterium]
MLSPFDTRFDLPAARAAQREKPLGLRALAVIMVPAALAAFALAYPGLAHAAKMKPSEGFAPAMPVAAPAKVADGA